MAVTRMQYNAVANEKNVYPTAKKKQRGLNVTALKMTFKKEALLR